MVCRITQGDHNYHGMLIHPAVWSQTWAENLGLCPFGGAGSRLTQCGLERDCLRTKWHLDSSSCLATIDMGRIIVGGGCCAPYWAVELGPHRMQGGLGRDLPLYQVTS